MQTELDICKIQVEAVRRLDKMSVGVWRQNVELKVGICFALDCLTTTEIDELLIPNLPLSLAAT